VSTEKFKPGQHVMHDGQEYIFHCYVTKKMALEDFGGSNNEYAYIDSVADDKMHDVRLSQNGRRYYCAYVSGITPMPQVLHSEADSLDEIPY
jgi:hypothetical protein